MWEETLVYFSFVFLLPGAVTHGVVYLQHAGSHGNPADCLPVSISMDGLAKRMLRPEVQR